MKSIVGWYTRNKNVPEPGFLYYSYVILCGFTMSSVLIYLNAVTDSFV